MLIKEWMSKSVITIESKDSLNDAIKLFQTRVILLLERVDTANEPLSRLFSVFDIG